MPGGLSGTGTLASRRGAAGIVGLSLLFSACGDSSGDDTVALDGSAGSTTTTDAGTPTCAVSRNTVAFTVFGAATPVDLDALGRWSDNPDDQPAARAGAAEVVAAYRDLGYEILYVVQVPSVTQIGDQPLVDAVTVWLGVNDFPVGESTSVWAWDGEGDASVALIEKLTRLRASGVEFDAGYAADADVAYSLASGGVPPEQLFTVGEGVTGESYVSLPDDLTTHVGEIKDQDSVCEP